LTESPITSFTSSVRSKVCAIILGGSAVLEPPHFCSAGWKTMLFTVLQATCKMALPFWASHAGLGHRRYPRIF